eukprot:TRINITY_DN6332_c0_g7_i1.p1 TRINITY_DN6332_c0_g7~~TRINITY_DN6332_c0_g7_i1.p1  ORF type:complete len:265 (+),score=93.50 TRINITY_DN6332_c0_g7_i1:26-820(+)
MQTRTTNLNGRPGDADSGVALSGNYYPIVSRAYIIDEKEDWQFTILTGHSHGGSSLHDGELEIMVHRRLLRDDGRGVGQALNDTHTVEPKFWLIFANQTESALLHRKGANVLQYPLQSSFLTITNSDVLTSLQTGNNQFSGLVQDLPPNVRILSLKQLNDNTNRIILRLMNPFEVDENPQYSVPVNVDLNTLFDGYTITDIEERTLTTNMPASKNVRPQWNTFSESNSFQKSINNNNSKIKINDDTIITLYPMDIKSYWVTFTA